ncbi:hypothetical protein [uncultured Acetatifactor sp.]|jgi:hypothetical protein|uniref:hypothetical protein n=1 Tax=uncultured Acetatifactor sp. TaxID=1671927 RepID=UPI00262BC5FD|nr:hypothetical protein [uncultured Acetatifactor sp.]
MHKTQDQEAALLREELSKLLTTLRHNREKVPLDVLKTRYKKGYDTLCENIRRSASGYAKKITLCGIRIHRDYLDEAAAVVNGTIERCGILKQLSKAAFSHQDIDEFDSLAGTLREKILADLEPFYMEHLGLYISPECLEDPDVPPLIYCMANDCVLQDGKWIPLEFYKTGSAYQQEKCV